MPKPAAQVAVTIMTIVSDWSTDQGECKPSAVCTLAADISVANYQQCAGVLSKLLEQGQIKLEPQGRGLYIP